MVKKYDDESVWVLLPYDYGRFFINFTEDITLALLRSLVSALSLKNHLWFLGIHYSEMEMLKISTHFCMIIKLRIIRIVTI